VSINDRLAALGAFLSGVGAVLTSIWFVRRQRKQAREDCDRRLAEFERALHEGIEIERSHDEIRPTG